MKGMIFGMSEAQEKTLETFCALTTTWQLLPRRGDGIMIWITVDALIG